MTPLDLDVDDLKPIIVTSDTIRLANGTIVPDVTLVTVSSLKRYGTQIENFGEISTTDLDPNTDRVQIAANNGVVSFTINPPAQAGAGVVLAATVDGSAQGEAYFNVVETLDSDGNGLPDYWESTYFEDIGQDPSGDPDQDGLTNIQEYLHQTDPTKADTDSDGMPDGWEAEQSLNPIQNDADSDPDSDGFTNLQEYRWGTDPNDADSYPVAPDLTGSWKRISSSMEGKEITGVFEVRNMGKQGSKRFAVAFYLSDDSETPSERPFKTVHFRAGLRAGENSTFSISKAFTQSVCGKYVIGVIDPEQRVIEVEEENNVVSEVIP